MLSRYGELTAQRILDEINVCVLVQVVILDGGKYQLNVSEITKRCICDAERCIPLDAVASIESKKIFGENNSDGIGGGLSLRCVVICYSTWVYLNTLLSIGHNRYPYVGYLFVIQPVICCAPREF